MTSICQRSRHVGDDEERGIEGGRRIPEEGIEDQILRPFHVELDRIHLGKALPVQELDQGHGRHADRVGLARIDDLQARLAAVARVEEQGELAGLVGHGAVDRLDRARGVLADVVDQAVEDLGLGLHGQNPGRDGGSGLLRQEERVPAHIRAHVDEGEARA